MVDIRDRSTSASILAAQLSYHIRMNILRTRNIPRMRALWLSVKPHQPFRLTSTRLTPSFTARPPAPAWTPPQATTYQRQATQASMQSHSRRPCLRHQRLKVLQRRSHQEVDHPHRVKGV